MTSIKQSKTKRIFFMTQKLMSNPGKTISLKYFVDNLGAAKSTISEDLAQIKNYLEESGEGTLYTLAGKHGGIKFIPRQSSETIANTLSELENRLTDQKRILPGGYLYMSDIVSDPDLLKKVGGIFAGYFINDQPDIVLTIETKGILLAGVTADYLGIPLAIARNNSRVTEGAVISINYISGSSNKIQTMSLPTRAIEKNSRVLLIDDFMKQGGTLKGLKNLTKEFESKVVGKGVLLERGQAQDKLITDYLSFGIINKIDEEYKDIDLRMNLPEKFIRN
ncbi:pur operon repressor [Natranaerobius trueperi]|uniref:Pur operon repressor n=1 Tax=Natranaerobius trueperi TaxID=759412 RepID=A0A226BZP7_9FIRM|nr:pur operon repressor [Natranaerobius trueperi]OWZ83659.1 pur operon repressor [Natranaerobius trueperi]